MEEKNYKNIIEKIAQITNKVYLVNIDNKRAVKADVLFKYFAKYISKANIIKCSIRNCFKKLNDGKTVLCIGSFFLAGNILKFIKEN